MELAISGQVLGDARSLEEILEVLQRQGVSAIELWPANVPSETGGAGDAGRYEGRSVTRARELLKAYGISAACVTMPGVSTQALVTGGESYGKALAYAVEVAAALGAAVVNHYCVGLAPDERADLARAQHTWEKAIQRAEERSVFLALENESHDATRTPAGMLRVLESVGSARFGTNFDACNYYHASQEGFPYAYDVLKDWIRYVHIKDGCVYNPAAGHGEAAKGTSFSGAHAPECIYYVPAGQGAMNTDGLLTRLTLDGYDGYCTLEPHTAPEVVESYYRAETAYLRARGFFLGGKGPAPASGGKQ
jgi:sugar phosphate isomerase/epimerase